jgi:hypothetical protein
MTNNCQLHKKHTFYLCVLCNGAIRNRIYIALNESMSVNNELELMLKEAVMTYSKALSLHMPRGSEESHEKPYSA